MEALWIIVLAVAAYVWVRSRKPTRGTNRSRPGGRKRTPRSEHPEWLKERWALAEQLRGSGSSLFPGWYYDPMTEPQARRLDDGGRSYSRSITKGQASDLIGLDESASADDLAVLRFFKRPTRGMNQTKARHEVATLFSDDANRRAWEDRPMDARQREFFRFFGMRVRASLGHKEAEALSDETYRQASEANDPRVRHWDIYEQILEELDDPDFREAYDLRKPRPSAVRKAIEGLVASGTPWEDLDADAVANHLTYSD